MRFHVAVIQPLTIHGPGSREENLANARKHLQEAARRGAQVVCFPETYPGAWRAPVTWTPVLELQEMAREAGVYLVGSYAEPADEEGYRCYMSASLIGPDGREIGRYRRTTPEHAPWIYKGGPLWDIDWVHADDLPVFETDLGKMAVLICSEVYAPELSRILALKGAELVFMPAGAFKRDLFETWRTLIWARAIENLMYTTTCQNISAAGEYGLAVICGPEEILVEGREPGVHVAPVDLDRIRWLRAEQDRLIVGPKPWRTKPGTLRDWRRQEVFEANPVLQDVPVRISRGRC